MKLARSSLTGREAIQPTLPCGSRKAWSTTTSRQGNHCDLRTMLTKASGTRFGNADANEDLGGGGDRDHFRVLATNARDTNRRGDSSEV